MDRYTKTVLTLIAAALVYLCVVFTPMPTVQAQFTQRPGEPTGPVQVVIVGWRGAAGETVPVSSPSPLTTTVNGLVEVRGQVKTERANDRAERVVLAGWEEGAAREGGLYRMRNFTDLNALPVNVKR